MPATGERRRSYRWRLSTRKPLIGAWHRQRSNNSFIMGEALPPGGSLLAQVELLRPGSEVLGYVLHLYSDGQGWVNGEQGIELPFDTIDIEGDAGKVYANGRIQPTNDPTIFYHRSSKTQEMMVKIGHTSVSGYYLRCYTWVTAYECTEEWDGQRWVEVG